VEVPPELAAALEASPAAKAHFETLNKVNRYAIIHRIVTLKKPESRAKKVEWAIDLLVKGEKIH
jgi:uncharacterized protein YdeI (YjbR/CyaY-like superfamily)